MTAEQRRGTSLGDYHIERLLGRGGMGVVYRARHATTGQVVALKLMLPELAANEAFRERFIREAEFAPVLDHPNIVPVYETGEVEGELFIAMRLVEGHDLKGLIKREGHLPVRRVLSILRQAASALDAAHEMVVVHRDVKPQNILVEDDPRLGSDHVFLTDFGLIRPLASESTGSRTGPVFGSLQYMAPEQIEGLPADGRADIYSLACVAYECLTGVIPFERANEVGVIWAHIHEDPPRVTDVLPDLPGGLDDVIRRGMAKHPDDRYATCGELVSDLEEGLKKQRRQLVPTPLRPLVKRTPRRKTERDVWSPNFFPELARARRAANRPSALQTLVLGTLLVLLGGGLIHFTRDGGITEAAADVAGGLADVVENIVPGEDDDGASDAPESAAGSGESNGRGRPDDATNRRPQRDVHATPNGSSSKGPRPVASDTAGKVITPSQKETALNGPIIFSTWMGTCYEWVCSPTYGALGPDIWRTDPDGTNGSNLTNHPDSDYAAQASPDGSLIAFRSDRNGNGDVFVMDVEGQDVRQVTSDPANDTSPTWSPDGRRIVYLRESDRSEDIFVMNADGSGRRLVASFESIWGLSWSPDGKWIGFVNRRPGNNGWGTGNDDIYLVRPNGEGVRKLAGTRRFDEGAPSWAPDSHAIVFDRTAGCNSDNSYCDSDLWTIHLDGSHLTQLAGSPSAEFAPEWSPDGKKIAYTSDQGDPGYGDLFVMNRDGSVKTRVLARPESLDQVEDWLARYR